MKKKPPIFKFPERYHERLEQIGQMMGRILWVEAGKAPITQADAQRIAFEITEKLRSEHGGGQFYLARNKDHDLEPRDRAIWDDFKGNNYFELAQKYDLSDVRVREIVEEQKQAALRRNQQSFDGCGFDLPPYKRRGPGRPAGSTGSHRKQ